VNTRKADTRTTMSHNNNKIAILDAGSQFQKVIDRRIRELCVECDIFPLDTPAAELTEYQAIIISGGPQSVTSKDAPAYDPELFHLKCPLLGICYGMQLMNYADGGTISKMATREDGVFDITFEHDSPIFKGLGSKSTVLLTHGDSVDQPADGYSVLARSPEGLVAAIGSDERRHYGLQFHPEVDLSVDGVAMFSNFLDIAGFDRSYTIPSRKAKAIKEIQQTVGDKSVIVLVSGGVDSSVCVALVRQALPAEKIFACHVDHGFMRKDESVKVKAALEAVGVKLDVMEAADMFAEATTEIDGVQTPILSKAVAPEQKRKIIGDTFMKVADMAMKKYDLHVEDVMLVQGTLRPDLIESASKVRWTSLLLWQLLCSVSGGPASTRETFLILDVVCCIACDFSERRCILHQNAPQRHKFSAATARSRFDMCLKQKLVQEHFDLAHSLLTAVHFALFAGRIVEPLKDYHKDEARILGKELGLPDDLVWRQPFPGPGLAIRILCCTGAVLPEESVLQVRVCLFAFAQ